MMMNLGFLVAGLLFDGLRSGLGEHGGMNVLGQRPQHLSHTLSGEFRTRVKHPAVHLFSSQGS